MTEPDGNPSQRPKPTDLESLEARLSRARGTSQDVSQQADETDSTLLGMAWRLSTDFLAAVVVGVGLGWLLDRFAGTQPFGIVGGLILGSAAGIRQVFVTAARMDAEQNKADAAPQD